MAKDLITGSPLRGIARFLTGDTTDVSSATPEARRRARVAIHAGTVVVVGVVLTIVWATTSRGFYWPIQALLPLALSVGVHAWIVRVAERPEPRSRFADPWLAGHLGVSALMWLYLVGLWAVGNRGYFWPAWALLGLAALAGLHAVAVGRRGRDDPSEAVRR
jgi:hypothetical protein